MRAAASCTLAVKVIPNAPRNEIVGWLGQALKIKVHAPALEGRANDALCQFIADQLALPARAVTVKSGDKSRQKTLLLSGLTALELQVRLERLLK